MSVPVKQLPTLASQNKLVFRKTIIRLSKPGTKIAGVFGCLLCLQHINGFAIACVESKNVGGAFDVLRQSLLEKQVAAVVLFFSEQN